MKYLMKQNVKILIAGVLGVAALVAASRANALEIGVNDSYYLGYFAPPQPAGDALERANVQNLIYLFNEDAVNYVENLNDRTFVVPAGSGGMVPTPAPDLATGNGVQQLAAGAFTFDVSSAEYLMAKYANQIAHVWYVGELDEVTLPDLGDQGNGWGLSHVTRFDSWNRVPDGGMTLALLGMGVMGVGIARRRFVK